VRTAKFSFVVFLGESTRSCTVDGSGVAFQTEAVRVSAAAVCSSTVNSSGGGGSSRQVAGGVMRVQLLAPCVLSAAAAWPANLQDDLPQSAVELGQGIKSAGG